MAPSVALSTGSKPSRCSATRTDAGSDESSCGVPAAPPVPLGAVPVPEEWREGPFCEACAASDVDRSLRFQLMPLVETLCFHTRGAPVGGNEVIAVARVVRWRREPQKVRATEAPPTWRGEASAADIHVEQLTVEYTLGSHRSRPIDNMTFHARGDQIVVATGPSGCGKTTLLSVLAGLLTPTQRKSRRRRDETSLGLKGRDKVLYRRRSVGVIFQAFNLVPSLTALENVMAPLVLTGVRSAPARRRALHLLEEVSLSGHASKRPGQLSGGQQQRVAFARAMVFDPPLVLADEPTAHLDQTQVSTILELIQGMRKRGRLIVVATHDRRFDAIADQVLQMGAAEGMLTRRGPQR